MATAVGKRLDLPPARRDDGLDRRHRRRILDDSKITARLPEVEARLTADAWAQAGRAIMTTDTFPKGGLRHGDDRRRRGQDRRASPRARA
ncbi:hypothetical protein ACRAWD_01310 [Caulobacter segnis]